MRQVARSARRGRVRGRMVRERCGGEASLLLHLTRASVPVGDKAVWRAHDAAVGDDGRDEFRGRHVKGGIVDGDSGGRDPGATPLADLVRIAVLDRNVSAGWRGGIDR